MHIRFKPSLANAATTVNTVLATIAYAATANANTTMTYNDVVSFVSSTGYGDTGNIVYLDYATISNSEAGGWSVNQFDLGSIGTGGTDNDFVFEMQANSPKASRIYTDFKKTISLAGTQTGSTVNGFFAGLVGFKDATSNTHLQNYLNYNNQLTTTSSDGSGFPFTDKMQDYTGYWNISVTSKYCYIWITGERGADIGVADFVNLNPSWMHESVKGYNHVGYFHSHSVTSNSSDIIVAKLSTISGATGTQDTVTRYYNITSTVSSTSTPVIYNHTGSSAWPMFPAYDNGRLAYSSFYPSYDNKAQKVGTIVPLSLTQPFTGINHNTIEGMGFYTLFQGNVTAGVANLNQNRIIYDQNGTKWALLTKSNTGTIRAIRSA